MATRKTAAQSDPLKPAIGLLAKLGSIIVHADEFIGPCGHEFDRMAIQQLLADDEVKAWIKAIGPMLQQKRS